MTWSPGDVVTFEHLCFERAWGVLPVRVVLDEPGLVALYLPGGAPMTYYPGPWPTATGEHPWHPRTIWSGHGILMLQRPGDRYGAWVFWDGPERAFQCWYLNIHDWSRTPTGAAIRDLELDVVVAPDGSCRLKDEELLDQRVAEGRLTAGDIADARAVAGDLVRMVGAGESWWDPAWAAWIPPDGWDYPQP